MWDAYYKITIMMTDIWTILLLWLLLIDFMNEADFSKTSFHSGKCHIFHTREMLNVKCCFTLFGHTPYSHSWLWVPHIKIADLWSKCRDEAYPKCLLGEVPEIAQKWPKENNEKGKFAKIGEGEIFAHAYDKLYCMFNVGLFGI